MFGRASRCRFFATRVAEAPMGNRWSEFPGYAMKEKGYGYE